MKIVLALESRRDDISIEKPVILILKLRRSETFTILPLGPV
jgi:hypothetical protein